jgi:hypothetical protein
MYTIGTSSLKFLRTKIETDHPDAFAALDKRMLAFVGTAADRAATMIAPYSSFFELQGSIPETVQLYIPIDTTKPSEDWPLTPNAWDTVDTPFNQAFITEWLTPAGGLANGLYAIQRGNLADMETAFKYPGLMYFAKDKEDLYVCKDNAWVRVSSIDAVFIGTIINYPEQFDLSTEMKLRWMRCDGHTLTQQEIAAYPDFAALIQGKFGTGYVLPFQNNYIIRVIK